MVESIDERKAVVDGLSVIHDLLCSIVFLILNNSQERESRCSWLF